MKKKLVALCAIMLLASGCGKVPKLDNGKDAIVSFKNGDKISVDDFYSKLKDDMGLNTLITMIDTYICETEFKDYKDTASKNAQAYIDAFIEQYGGKDKFLEALQSQTNYQTIDAYQNYLYLANLQSHAIEEYAKTKITDKEIKAYYDDEAIGDMEINHILITADVKDGAKDDEKKKAEEAAKKTVNEIIEKLKTAKKNKEDITEAFTKLAKEYSKDENSSSNGGSLGKVNTDSVPSEVFSALLNLKDGSYSTSPVKSSNGYHILYRKSQDKKPELNDELTEKIKTTIGSEIAKESGFSIKALKALREKNEMKILDTELNKDFETLVNRQTQSASNSSSNK